MKRMLSLFIAIFAVTGLSKAGGPIVSEEKSDSLTIDKIYTNTGKITINGRTLNIGDKFAAGEVIEWTNDADCIKVFNNRTKERYTLPAVEFKHYSDDSKLTSFIKWFVRKNHMGSKSGSTASERMREIFHEPQFMTDDTLRIKSFLPMSDSFVYTIREVNSKNQFIVPWDLTTNEIVITLDLLRQNGCGEITGSPLTFEVIYWNKHEQEMTASMTIRYIRNIFKNRKK